MSIACGLLPAACFVDVDDPCRGNEVFDETTFVCGCPAGYALSADGCTKCGKHEVVTNGSCACEDGYAKANADATCTKVEAPPPAPETGDGGTEPAGSVEPTGDEPKQLSAEGEGTDCPGGDECGGFPDANSCSFTPAGPKCSILNCTLEPNNCPDQYLCCDVTALAPGAPNVCIKDACP